eukprot:TRINITY_DN121327_c0_g1_i1.p1 TRINITY_DN121327_c0_g1~~TRINITY_DN121327_c0_g1_i1.p1  ORF type:complete len:535 (+),score=96.37 TRINITY_DN121327_c0_g1_i1:195-1799(+)
MDCTICFTAKDSYFALPCKHRFCVDCLKTNFETAAREGELGRLVCPEPACRLDLCKPAHLPVLRDILEAADFAEVNNALNKNACRGRAFCSCPKCATVSFLGAQDLLSDRGRRVVCNACDFQFCSKCCGDRYHYNIPSTSQDCRTFMREKEASWLLWLAEGMPRYLSELAKRRSAFAQRLKSYEEDLESRKSALERFRQDEATKQNWVHCPHCDAVWAGSDACESVTCGILEARMRMGDQRSVVGCGRPFSLRGAKRYTPVQAPALDELVKPEEEGEEEARHHVACDRCQTEIRGMRFRCLHCSSFDLCIGCLAQHGPRHDAELAWPEKSHVFDIMRRPTERSTTADTPFEVPHEDTVEIAVALALSVSDDGTAEASLPPVIAPAAAGGRAATLPPAANDNNTDASDLRQAVALSLRSQAEDQAVQEALRLSLEVGQASRSGGSKTDRAERIQVVEAVDETEDMDFQVALRRSRECFEREQQEEIASALQRSLQERAQPSTGVVVAVESEEGDASQAVQTVGQPSKRSRGLAAR